MNVWTTNNDSNANRRAIYNETDPIPLEVIFSGASKGGEGVLLNFYAEGPGFNGGQVGKQAIFKFGCNEEPGGRPRDIPLDKLKVKFYQPGKDNNLPIKQVSTGSWESTFTPDRDGEWTFELSYSGNKALQKNILFSTKAHAVYVLRGGPTSRLGMSSSIVLQAKDRIGSDINFGGEAFKCSVDGPKGGVSDFNVTDNRDGTYKVGFKLTVAGNYDFTIKWNDKAIDGSPVNVKCQ